jgi:UDP-glucose 4-epimerase
MKVLLTGASGFIGSAVLARLVSDGHEVTTVSLRWGDPELLPAAIHKQYEAVIHAGWGGVQAVCRDDVALQRENVRCTNQLLRALTKNPPRVFVMFGSQAEIYQVATPYAQAKIACRDSMEAQKDLFGRMVWLRLFSVYGENESPGWFIPSITRQLLAHKTVALTPGEQELDYLHVSDVATAVATAIAPGNDAEGIYEVGSGAPVKLRTVVETLRELCWSNSKIHYGALPYRANQVMRACAKPQEFMAATGWKPAVELAAGLKAVVEHHSKPE